MFVSMFFFPAGESTEACQKKRARNDLSNKSTRNSAYEFTKKSFPKIINTCRKVDDFDVGSHRKLGFTMDFAGVSPNMDGFSLIVIEIAQISGRFSVPHDPCVAPI